MKIGLDFGTTNSAVSYVREDGSIESVTFGGASVEKAYVPSFVAFKDSDAVAEIGEEARHRTGHSRFRVFCHFKMLLGETELARARGYDSGSASPDAITRLYLAELFKKVHKHSGKAVQGLVITAPEVWFREGQHAKRERLIEACRGAGIRHVEVRSEPEAAAVYFLRRYTEENPDKPFNGHVLVCDCGGGTIDFCLTRIETGQGKPKFTVLERTGVGVAEKTLGAAGVAYDEAVIDAVFPGLREKDLQRFNKFLIEFESEKILRTDEVDVKLDLYLDDPDSLKEEVLTVDDTPVLAEVLVRVFDEVVRPGLRQAIADLQQFLERERIETRDGDRFRVLMVGGFSNYFLVRNVVRKGFGAVSKDLRFNTLFIPRDTALAISKGAAIIANNEVTIVQHCPATVGIVTSTDKDCTKIFFVPVLEKGKSISEYKLPRYHEGLFISSGSGQITIFIEIKKKPVQLPLDIHMLLPDTYRKTDHHCQYLQVGFSIDDNMIFTLHLRHVDEKGKPCGGEQMTALGDLIEKTGGLIMVTP